MSNYLTIRGFASSPVELHTKDSGLVIGKFRMGSNDRVLDPSTNEWGDGPTNWYRVNTFRTLAGNVAASIKKGDRIIVTGKLKINTYTKLDGTQGMSVEIDADSVGADLKFGSCAYHRNSTQRPGSQPQHGQQSPDDSGATSEAGFNTAEDGRTSTAPDLDAEGGEVDEDDDEAAAAAQNADGSAVPDEDGRYEGAGDNTDEEAYVDKETGELVKSGPPF
ncbi:single-stranded DNA-binding protein [Arthrobacter sp. SDTb3-6]|uniref:single-stranded DNA-binding protein n=1 Tax=Arthrobacter sp. SDTb3-6 TaxID=2713571 RepID=UPI00159DC68D|nr:single-stranded DNA-binding protein [Arthrobacter sp. SDTb3-6]NVM98431.1 single-stranded DNA-binding protein [Arthrobacter sp. SDTb3-6]